MKGRNEEKEARGGDNVVLLPTWVEEERAGWVVGTFVLSDSDVILACS